MSQSFVVYIKWYVITTRRSTRDMKSVTDNEITVKECFIGRSFSSLNLILRGKYNIVRSIVVNMFDIAFLKYIFLLEIDD